MHTKLKSTSCYDRDTLVLNCMAKKKKKKRNRDSNIFDDISPHTKQAIGAILFTVFGIFFVFSSFGYAGNFGSWTHTALVYLFGYGFMLAPIVCALFVYVLLKPRDDERVSLSKIIGVTLFFLSTLGLLELSTEHGGGILGNGLTVPLYWLFGTAVSGITLGAFFIIGLFLTFNTSFIALFKRADSEENESELDTFDELSPEEESEITDEESSLEVEDAADEPKQKSFVEKLGLKNGTRGEILVSNFSGPYDPPPLTLLNKDGNKARGGDIKANANIIKRTLKNFNIEVEMDEVKIGPSVTQYALKPAEGVRISKIVGLQSNLELALAASPIRIEAPIPGQSLVGIEVPNTQKQRLGLASLLSSPEYVDSPKPLLVALGKDISGSPHFANIAKMPHALIAGTTGSGKSVMIHSVVTSLLFRNSPEQLRFIMVDPKRVELTLYNDIPHLLTPVITDAKKAILALKWAAKEMERRYDILQAERVRDLDSYHSNIYQPAMQGKKEDDDELPEPLPFIVVIIDELADIMSAYPRELEASIVRLAQMSRAVGIHLILSTQRPSVNVITGLIKANIPARLALKVASQIDSRTILDQVGAEKLLGQGDMLFLSGELSKPSRLQSAFISEEELKKVVSYLKKQTDLQELDSINFDSDTGGNPDAFFESSIDDEDEDDLYEDAKAAVIVAGKASTSYIQRKLRVGYSRAARLMDMLEERGVIGPADGSKPREVLSGGNTPEEDNEEDET